MYSTGSIREDSRTLFNSELKYSPSVYIILHSWNEFNLPDILQIAMQCKLITRIGGSKVMHGSRPIMCDLRAVNVHACWNPVNQSRIHNIPGHIVQGPEM